jgi:two-component system, LuxR family, sensor kinase FixL
VAPAKDRPAARNVKRTATAAPEASATALQEQLEEQLRFERIISDLSARFVRIPSDRLDEEITHALDELRVFFGCDRCGLLRPGAREGSFQLTHISFGEGIEQVPQHVDLAAIFPWSYDMYFGRGEPIVFASTKEVPPEAAVDKETAIAMGVKSSLGIPLFTGDGAKHAIVFQAMREERSWSDLVVQRVKTLGEIFVNALERRRAEEALRESEERLNLAAEAAEAGFWVLDAQGLAFWGTQKIKELFSLSEGESPSVDRIFGAIHPEDRARAREAMDRAWETSETSGVEYRVILPDGGVRWLVSRGRAFAGGSSAAHRLMGVTYDISERKRMEAAARLNEQEFRTMFDLSAVGMAQVDPATGRFLRANAKYCDVTGYSLEEMQKLTYRDLTHPEDAPHDDVQYARVLAGEAKFWSHDKRYVRKDGTICWVSVSGTVLHDETGRPVRSLAAIVDITDRHMAEEALRESEAKYRGLYESLRDAYVRVDLEGMLLEWNGAYGAMLGYSDEELRQLTYQAITPDRWNVAEAKIIAGQVLVRGYSEVYEKEYRRKDGTVFPVELRTFLLRDGSGRPSGLWAIVRDLSERRRAEEESQALRDELAHVTRVSTLGELTASLAHELNQPLTAIQSNAQTAQRLLERGGVAAGELTDILEDIVADNRRASEMIRHLRAALKKGKTAVQPLDVGELVQEVTALVLPDILKRDATLSLDLAEETPQVRGDKIQLQQVLMNLMVNSLDAMENSEGGHLWVRIRVHEPGEVQISVEDSGPGIPGDRLEGIFEPFYTTKPEGLGMGLAICRSITRAHGGRLWVENRPEGGAAFHLRLPAAPADG